MDIREGIQRLIDNNYDGVNPDYPNLKAFRPMKFLNELMPYLKSEGLVRKVEGELPALRDYDKRQTTAESVDFQDGFIVAKIAMLKAGYCKVEEL